MVLPPEVTIFRTPLCGGLTRVGILGLLEVGVLGGVFLTGMPLGTDKTLFSDFFRLKVNPPFSLTTSVSGLKLSTSTFPSS